MNSEVYNYRKDSERIRLQAEACKSFDIRNIQEILESFSAKEFISIIDIGCGDGYLTASRFGNLKNVSILGIDINPEAIENAKINSPLNFKFLVKDLAKDNLDDLGTFDIAFSANALHHIKNPKNVIQNIWNKINPGGYFIIRTFDDSSKISYPTHPALKILFDDYNKVSPSDRFFSSQLNSIASILRPNPSNISYDFFTECSVNYSKTKRTKFFEDVFRFRIENSWANLTTNEIDLIHSFRRLFINNKSFFFSTTHHLIKIKKP